MQVSAIDTLSRQAASILITVHQKHLSPRKGFSCAYRVMHGREKQVDAPPVVELQTQPAPAIPALTLVVIPFTVLIWAATRSTALVPTAER